MTVRDKRNECDINVIMSRAKVYGDLPNGKGNGVYTDVSQMPDYHTCLLKVKAADAAFAALPSHVRKRFDNKPLALVEFLSKEENRAEAEKLGLVNKRKEPPKPSQEAPKTEVK